MALYRKALRDMNSLLSIKLANCPVNRQKEVGEQQKKARDFKEQSEERIGILGNLYAIKYLSGSLEFFDQMFYLNFKSK